MEREMHPTASAAPKMYAALGRLEHGCGRPAQRHGCITPALDVAADAADQAHDVLDDAGAGEHAAQLAGQAEANHG